MSVEGIFKGITRAKKEGNSIEGTGGQKRGQTRNCNLPCPSMFCCVLLVEDARMTINQGGKGKPIYFLALLAENPNINGKTLLEQMLSKIGIFLRR